MALLVCMSMGLLLFVYKEYLMWEVQHIIMLALLPIFWHFRPEKSPIPWMYSIVITTLCLLQVLYPATSFQYALAIFSCLFVVQIFGSISHTLSILLCLHSPIFYYVKNSISTPLRLQFTEWSSKALQPILGIVEAKGNIIYLSDTSFVIDESCTGLKFISYGLLFALLCLRFTEIKRNNQYYSIWGLSKRITGMVLLLLFSNLIRIVCLILFRIGPEQASHYYIGLLCLALACGIFLILNHFPTDPAPKHQKGLGVRPILWVIPIVSFILMTNQKQEAQTLAIKQAWAHMEIKELTKQNRQYANDQLLIYQKPIRSAFAGEHHPLVCWKAIGYVASHIEKVTDGPFPYYTAKLTKDETVLYTSWWIENGEKKYSEQWEWRKAALFDFSQLQLINITSESLEPIQECIQQYELASL